MKKNLIMGIVKGYGWLEIEPFFVSWQRNSNEADCIIFYDDVSAWTEKHLYKFAEKKGNGNLRFIKIPEIFKNRLVIDFRCSIYKQFLQDNQNKYNQALLTDVRDVIFQDNLFNYYEKYESYLGYSTESLTLAEPTNAGWITKFFGVEEYEKLKNNNIICNGTIWGTCRELINFLQKMEDMIKLKQYWGVDQAIANYIIYNKLLPIDNMIKNDVNTGLVFTNGYSPTSIKNGKILNLSGKIPAVVHQYDRHIEMNNFIVNLYQENDLKIDDNYTDIRSNLDIASVMISRKDFSRALEKFIYLIDNYPDRQIWENTLDKLIICINNVVFSDIKTFSAEMLTQAICYTLILSFNEKTDYNKISKLYMFLSLMKQNQRTIYKPFERTIGNFLWQFALIFDRNDNVKFAHICLDHLKLLDYPFNTDYYLLSAKYNRLFGNKEEALNDYKKALAEN